jgi:hypothetical protein
VFPIQTEESMQSKEKPAVTSKVTTKKEKGEGRKPKDSSLHS